MDIIPIGAAVFVAIVIVFAVYAHTQGLDLAALLEPRAAAPKQVDPARLAAMLAASASSAIAAARAAIPEPGALPVSPAASVEGPATKGYAPMQDPIQVIEDIGKRAVSAVEAFDGYVAGEVKKATDALTAIYDAKVGALESTVAALEVKLGLRAAPAPKEAEVIASENG